MFQRVDNMAEAKKRKASDVDEASNDEERPPHKRQRVGLDKKVVSSSSFARTGAGKRHRNAELRNMMLTSQSPSDTSCSTSGGNGEPRQGELDEDDAVNWGLGCRCLTLQCRGASFPKRRGKFSVNGTRALHQHVSA